jgi:putative transposase
VLVQGVKQYLESMIKHLDHLDEDIEVITVNVQTDHVHLVVIIPPRLSVASVVQFIKTNTAKRLRQKFNYLEKTYVGQQGLWSRGYCVSTIGYAARAIINYVKYQEKEDKGQLQLDFGI